MSVPFWKVRRELTRFGRQVRGVPELVADPIRLRNLNRAVSKGLPRVDGMLPERPKVAALLVFQPNGVSDSTIDQCKWLADSGYAPLVVSNSPPRGEDIARLTPVIWRMIVRPNFGYDFGGYRDALLSLDQWKVRPKTLLVLNDSVWVPVNPETDLLSRLENSPADIAGSVLRERDGRHFLESYCYRIRGALLTDPSFRDFWSRLRLTSNKYYVVRRGERGFSEAMRRSGFSLSAAYDPAGLAKALAAADATVIYKTIRYSALIPTGMEHERRELLETMSADNPAWRDRALTFLDRILGMGLGFSTFPYAASRFVAYPFLKKSGGRAIRNWSEWRRVYLAAVDAGDIPRPPNPILAELRTRVKADAKE